MSGINRDGVLAFCNPVVRNFPVKLIQYKGGLYIVPDWSVHHDSGDEDDGEHKAINQFLREKGVIK